MVPESEFADGVRLLIRHTLAVDVPAADTDLLESGLLDSLALVTLIVDLEEHFDCRLPLDDFDLEDFRTVGRIAGLLGSLRSPARRSAG